MTVAIITDSACSLPADVAARAGVRVVPLHLHVGDTAYLDGELALDELVERLGDGVTTAGPSAGEFVVAIEAAFADGASAVLVLTISASMSSTFAAARLAASEVTTGPVIAFDTGTAAGAQGLVVLAAAECAADGGSIDDVVAVAERAADRVRLVATVDRLDQLVKSGRVPGIAGRAGAKLGVNPLFEFRRGEVRRLRPAFSRRAALERVVAAVRADRHGSGGRLHVAALHAVAEDDAKAALEAATDGEPTGVTFVGAFSPVMVAHTGPGLVGLAWRWDVVDPSS
jgi:DegV family protein with EDD domain